MDEEEKGFIAFVSLLLSGLIVWTFVIVSYRHVEHLGPML